MSMEFMESLKNHIAEPGEVYCLPHCAIVKNKMVIWKSCLRYYKVATA